MVPCLTFQGKSYDCPRGSRSINANLVDLEQMHILEAVSSLCYVRTGDLGGGGVASPQNPKVLGLIPVADIQCGTYGHEYVPGVTSMT